MGDQQQRQQEMGRHLRSARLAAHLSQEDVALRVDVTQSMISRYEAGRAVPEPEKRRALEKLLGMQPGELMTIVEPEALAAMSATPQVNEAVLHQIQSDLTVVATTVEQLSDTVRQLVDEIGGRKGPDRRSQTGGRGRSRRA